MWLTKHASKMQVSAGRSHLISASFGFTVSGTPLRAPTRSRNGWISLKRVEATEHTCVKSARPRIRYLWVSAAVRFSNTRHIVPGGTDKSNGGDYENRLRYVKFGGLAILKP